MKRLLFVAPLSLLCMLFSCKDSNSSDSNSAPAVDSTASAQADKNTENTKAVFRGIESGDLSKMNDFVSPDLVDHTPMGDVRGLDSVKKMLAEIHNHVPDVKMEMISDASNANYHFSLIKMTGTVKDNFMGMPANTTINDTSVGVEKIVNGKITDHWRFASPNQMMKMMSMSQHSNMSQHPNKK
jgi:predicted ester cyclase